MPSGSELAAAMAAAARRPFHIGVTGLTMAFGPRILQTDLTFTIRKGDVFVIMGGSGTGKSTLLRHLVGLQQPASGTVSFQGRSFWDTPQTEQQALQRRFGVMYQQGAL